MIGLQHIGDAALAGLAVDADHRLVVAADVLRVDRQIGHLEQRLVALLLRLEALLDRVLMRAGERGVDELADVRMALVNRQLGAELGHFADRVDVAQIEPRIDALGEEIERHGDDVDVAGALAVAEQSALDAVGAGHQRELRRGDRGAAIVVGMDGEDDAVAVGNVAAEPFELVGVGVRRRHLDRRRQVEDQPLLRRRTQLRLHRLADLEREIELGAGEALRRIFEDEFRLRRRVGERLDLLGGGDRDLAHAGAVGAEHDFALQRRGRVVEVQDDLLGAFDRLEGALDQLRPALGQHLDRDAVGDAAVFDDRADEVEVGLRGGGKGDLDLLEPHAGQQVEHAVLAIDPHGLDQRLVAVAQIDGAPDRGLVDEARRPLAVRQDDRREGAVFVDGHIGHDGPLRRLRGRSAPLQGSGARDINLYVGESGLVSRRDQCAGRVSRRVDGRIWGRIRMARK